MTVAIDIDTGQEWDDHCGALVKRVKLLTLQEAGKKPKVVKRKRKPVKRAVKKRPKR